jgi:hypothetical protein
MRKTLSFLGALLLCVSSVSVSAQGSLTGLFPLSVQIQPGLRIGYQSLAANVNIPIPTGDFISYPNYARQSALDLQLLDGGGWVGAATLDARTDRWSLFLTAEGIVPKSASVTTSSEFFWAGLYPVNWRVPRLEWWALDAGGSVNVVDGLSVVGGVRIEHLSLAMTDPVDPVGGLKQLFALGERYSGDFMAKVRIPYFGLEIKGFNYKGSLILGPAAWVDLNVPLRYLFVDLPDYVPMEASYKLNKGGLYLQGGFDYATRFTDDIELGFWFKGSSLNVRGNGGEDFTQTDVSKPKSETASGSYSSYTLGGGLSARFTF